MLRLFDVHIAKKHLLSKDNGCFLEIKKAETVASTFDMIAYDHRKSNKRMGR